MKKLFFTTLFLFASVAALSNTYDSTDKETLRNIIRQNPTVEVHKNFAMPYTPDATFATADMLDIDTTDWYNNDDWISKFNSGANTLIQLVWSDANNPTTPCKIKGITIKPSLQDYPNAVCAFPSSTGISIDGLDSLQSLEVSNVAIKKISVNDSPVLSKLNPRVENGMWGAFSLDANNCPSLTNLKADDVYKLSISGSGLKSFKVPYGMNSLNISNSKSLESLELTAMGGVNASGCTALETLEISGMEIGSIDVSNTALQSIKYYNYQKIGQIKASNCPNLESFSDGDDMQSLTLLDLSNCPKLTSVSCAFNYLTTLLLDGCDMLNTLSCSVNQLTTLQLPHDSITMLACGNNQLRFSTLPILANQDAQYYYTPQADIEEETQKTNIIDLSAEYNIGGNITNFDWDGLDPLPTGNNGVFTFTSEHSQKMVHCYMTNATFPGLTLSYTTRLPFIDAIAEEKPDITLKYLGNNLYSVEYLKAAELYDILGNRLANLENVTMVDVSQYNKGVYFLRSNDFNSVALFRY